FLTQQSGIEMQKTPVKRTIFSVLAALFGFAFSYNLISEYPFASPGILPFNASVEAIGTQMLSTTEYGFILPFEVVSMLLLSAMIGCIVIAMKTPEQETTVTKKVIGEQEDKGPTTLIIPTISKPVITEEVK